MVDSSGDVRCTTKEPAEELARWPKATPWQGDRQQQDEKEFEPKFCVFGSVLLWRGRVYPQRWNRRCTKEEGPE